VQPLGPTLAEGRDSEIFEHGPGRVLRVVRDGRSLVGEAEVMRYVRGHGYPVPVVFDAGDGFLVMERLDGPTLFDHAVPFHLRRAGAALADLHERLHAIPAPPGIRVAPVDGDRLVHRDLHPLNVLMTGAGPVVIDWSNASAGDPAFDVADTWVVLACADTPDLPWAVRQVAPLARRTFLRSFLGNLDREAARAAIPAAVAHRLTDRNHTDSERARMQALADWASNLSAP
jgi:aminoglycoside phosphotransferase (APT) family kinase protein